MGAFVGVRRNKQLITSQTLNLLRHVVYIHVYTCTG